MKNNIKQLLDNEVNKRNIVTELSLDKPDPLMIARKHKDEYISLMCALFAYGNAGLIVKLLSSFDFSLIDRSDTDIENNVNQYYRFQSNRDVQEFFKTIKIVKNSCSLQDLFYNGFKETSSVIDGIRALISYFYDMNSYRSKGYEFLLGSLKSNSPYKRYNMYLRWMVRNDNLDMGLWDKISSKDLIMPLDVHTFKVSQKLGLLARKTYDFKAALELTENLKELDVSDPVKYDFAIYRLGQEKLI